MMKRAFNQNFFAKVCFSIVIICVMIAIAGCKAKTVIRGHDYDLVWAASLNTINSYVGHDVTAGDFDLSINKSSLLRSFKSTRVIDRQKGIIKSPVPPYSSYDVPLEISVFIMSDQPRPDEMTIEVAVDRIGLFSLFRSKDRKTSSEVLLQIVESLE